MQVTQSQILSIQIHRIHNPHNDRDHAPVRVLQYLTCAISFTVDQYRITDSRLCVVQSDKVIFGRGSLTVHDQRLDDQQPAVLVMRVTDGRDDGADDFTKYQRVLLSCHSEGALVATEESRMS